MTDSSSIINLLELIQDSDNTATTLISLSLALTFLIFSVFLLFFAFPFCCLCDINSLYPSDRKTQAFC